MKLYSIPSIHNLSKIYKMNSIPIGHKLQLQLQIIINTNINQIISLSQKIKQISQYLIMKSIKTKRNTNSSFMSNHDLLENFRNKSFKLITRQSSNTSIKHQVSLIKKKSFQKNLDCNKENNPILSNNSYLDINKSKAQLQIIAKKANKCDYSVNLYQQNLENIVGKIIKELTFVHDELSSSDFMELQMIISKNINKLSGLIPKLSQSRRQRNSQPNNQIQKIQFLNKKIQDLKGQISKLKKEKTNLKEKVENLELKIEKNTQRSQNNSNQIVLKDLNIKNKQQKQFTKPQQSQNRLQKIIFSQSQIINNQCKNFQIQSNQMRLILKAQALKLQEILQQQNNKRSFKSQSFCDF